MNVARIKPGSIIPKRQKGDGTVKYLYRKKRANLHIQLRAELEAKREGAR